MTGVFGRGHSRGGEQFLCRVAPDVSIGHCQAKELPEIEPKVRHHTERQSRRRLSIQKILECIALETAQRTGTQLRDQMPLHPILVR
jgi:hypothetical protein